MAKELPNGVNPEAGEGGTRHADTGTSSRKLHCPSRTVRQPNIRVRLWRRVVASTSAAPDSLPITFKTRSNQTLGRTLHGVLPKRSHALLYD
jgi:hypothetical protein